MTPVNNTTQVISNVLETIQMPDKTYYVDFETKRITNIIDKMDALKQTIFFILNTTRYKHIIYSHNYGNELDKIIGLDFDLMKSEIERYTKECILSDDRFVEIRDFIAEPIEKDSMRVEFTVVTYLGNTVNIETEVSV